MQRITSCWQDWHTIENQLPVQIKDTEDRNSLLRFGEFTVGLKRVNGGSVERKPKRVTDEAQISKEILHTNNIAFREYAVSKSYRSERSSFHGKQKLANTKVKAALYEMIFVILGKCSINSFVPSIIGF